MRFSQFVAQILQEVSPVEGARQHVGHRHLLPVAERRFERMFKPQNALRGAQPTHRLRFRRALA
jgi:hypothetical protein